MSDYISCIVCRAEFTKEEVKKILNLSSIEEVEYAGDFVCEDCYDIYCEE